MKLASNMRWTVCLYFFVLAAMPATTFSAQQSIDKNTKNMQKQDMSHLKKTIELVYPANSAGATANHAIIWLHGLGASANDFPPIVPELGLNPKRPIRFVFPQAPNRPVTINMGMVMPSWYDIKGTTINDKQDAVGMAESKTLLDGLIQQQLDAGIPSENIIIAGFSQGGAVAYHTSLRWELPLAGLLTLSTYLPFADKIGNERTTANQDLAIFVSHGSHDDVVPIKMAEESVATLKELDYQLEWKTYPMRHEVSMAQIKDIGQWINQRFAD
jgi:phospholipase/carboxylesterase